MVDAVRNCMTKDAKRSVVSLVLKHLQTLKCAAVRKGIVTDGTKLVEGEVPAK